MTKCGLATCYQPITEIPHEKQRTPEVSPQNRGITHDTKALLLSFLSAYIWYLQIIKLLENRKSEREQSQSPMILLPKTTFWTHFGFFDLILGFYSGLFLIAYL